MNRRRFLAGVGMAAGIGSVSLGTGAFTSVSAERKLSVAVADDFRAFLRLEPMGDSGIDGKQTGRSSVNDREVIFEIPGDDSGENSDAKGVGPDSVYEFHGLLEIGNHGTQPINVFSRYNGSALNEVALIDEDGRLDQSPPTLDIGESVKVGLYIDTHESTTGNYHEVLTIVGERVGGNRD